jgi:hypothetical protein
VLAAKHVVIVVCICEEGETNLMSAGSEMPPGWARDSVVMLAM